MSGGVISKPLKSLDPGQNETCSAGSYRTDDRANGLNDVVFVAQTSILERASRPIFLTSFN